MFLTRDEKILIREILNDRLVNLQSQDYFSKSYGEEIKDLQALLHKFAVHFQEVPKKK